MMSRESMVGLATLGAVLLNIATASARVQPNTQEVHVYAGELFGDDLTDSEISGNTPTLEDDVTAWIGSRPVVAGTRTAYEVRCAVTNSW